MRERLRDERYLYEHRWLTLLVLCVSLMVIGLDNTILNVALPTLAKPKQLGGLGATGSDLQWIVDSYTIVFAGLLLTAGSLGDRFGRYRGLSLGLSVFGLGSALSTFATSASVLIATRALMGVGAAFIMPATLSILTNVFTDNRERAKAIGIWAGVSAVGIGFGPIAGGFLLTHFWWGSVFFVNVPVVIIGLVLGFRLVPDSRDPSAPALDPLGSLLSIVGLGALLWAIIEGPGKGWTSGSVLIGFAVGLLVMAAFFTWEATCKEPMLDVHFFANPRFSAASGAITLTFLALFGTIFLLTQYFQSVMGLSTIKAGAMLVPQAAFLMVFAPLSSRWVHRFGNKVVVVGGLGVVIISLLLMTTFAVNSSWLHVVLVTMLLGLGMAHVMPPATESIMGALPREKAGVGSAMNDTTRQVGGALGVALLGSISSSWYGSRVADSLRGVATPEVVARARDSVGAALGVARDDPSANPVATQIVDAAKQGFVDGFRVTVLVAAVIIAIAAVGVAVWLPSRAAGPDHADATDAVPMGIGPVDVIPADLAADLADELDELGAGRRR
jgi:EmrB/QacA subfamily drug resistance transporter